MNGWWWIKWFAFIFVSLHAGRRWLTSWHTLRHVSTRHVSVFMWQERQYWWNNIIWTVTVTVLFLFLVVAVAVLVAVVSVVPTMDVRHAGRTLSVLLPSSDSLSYHVSTLRGHYHRRSVTYPARRNYHNPLFVYCIAFGCSLRLTVNFDWLLWMVMFPKRSSVCACVCVFSITSTSWPVLREYLFVGDSGSDLLFAAAAA